MAVKSDFYVDNCVVFNLLGCSSRHTEWAGRSWIYIQWTTISSSRGTYTTTGPTPSWSKV